MCKFKKCEIEHISIENNKSYWIIFWSLLNFPSWNRWQPWMRLIRGRTGLPIGRARAGHLKHSRDPRKPTSKCWMCSGAVVLIRTHLFRAQRLFAQFPYACYFLPECYLWAYFAAHASCHDFPRSKKMRGHHNKMLILLTNSRRSVASNFYFLIISLIDAFFIISASF